MTPGRRGEAVDMDAGPPGGRERGEPSRGAGVPVLPGGGPGGVRRDAHDLLPYLSSVEAAGGATGGAAGGAGGTGPLTDLLALVINVVNFACHLCTYCAESGAVGAALALLEAVAAYSLLPRAALPTLVRALCRAANLDQHCQPSWKTACSLLPAPRCPRSCARCAGLPTWTSTASPAGRCPTHYTIDRVLAAARAALPTLVRALCRAANLDQHCQPSWKTACSLLPAPRCPRSCARCAGLPTWTSTASPAGRCPTHYTIDRVLAAARAALPTLVRALCRAANLDQHCQPSWKLMRCVLGADIGHAALQELVLLLRGEGGVVEDAGTMRGAVFYINMALWGPRRVTTLRVSLLAVLPALLQAVNAEQPVVTYEVVQALQGLVARAPTDALAAAWDLVLRLLARATAQERALVPRNELLRARLHAVLASLELLHEAGHYGGDVDALLALLEDAAQDRPEASALRVITWRAATLGRAAPAGRRRRRWRTASCAATRAPPCACTRSRSCSRSSSDTGRCSTPRTPHPPLPFANLPTCR
ncbi:hypothetical protein MSG28_003792 [Choristoneura fumiferana]|uniref:Uncharacterized protein n=1 Tax=Choristoneura fumiferana TaxID=7141 RepID=A0ACC0KGY9_CHOFU|nr:hypothetical protein MSG28_003792 [Choristoneura fumiferana]